MCSTAEGAEVVSTTTCREGICHQILRRDNGIYIIRIGGVRVDSLYWRAGELDRCLRALEQMMRAESQTMPAAA